MTDTAKQRANLAKLADFLDSGDPRIHFDMSSYTSSGPDTAHVLKCGSVGCAVGHGPMAGVSAKRNEDWTDYCSRVFTPDYDAWGWMFGASWQDVDPTAKGAARRIRHYLANGVPVDSVDQRWGQAPYIFAETAP